MAEINMNGGSRGKRRGRRTSPKVDLTPMVDLGFLLITFFMLTATLKKDYMVDLKLSVPGPASEVPASKAMTVVMGGGDKYYYYLGRDIDKMDSVISSQGIEAVIAKHNAPLIDSINRLQALLEHRQLDSTTFQNDVQRVSKENWALTVVVKAKDRTHCQQLVYMMDQLHKARVTKYALVDLEPREKLAMGN